MPYTRFRLFSSPVRFLSLFPASLPQPFHRCCLLLRDLTPYPSGFVHASVPSPLPVLPFFGSASRPLPPFASCFPFGPLSAPVLRARSASASAQLRSLPLPLLSFRFAPVRLGSSLLGLCFFLSPLPRSASQGLPVCPPRFPSPLGSALRFGFPLFPSVRASFLSVGSALRFPQLRYSVPLLFLSPLTPSPHSGCWCSLAFPLGFRPSP